MMTLHLRLELQPAVPYAEHLGWALSRVAYQAEGPESWLSGTMPHQISNNVAFARQMVQLLLASLPTAGDQPVRVLELGAGTGGFALYFIQQFAQLTAGSRSLQYLLSDPVKANLEALTGNPHFQPLLADGRLQLFQADLHQPGQLQDLNGQPVRTPALDLLLLNYVLCHQPFELLRAAPQGNGFERGLIATCWEPDLTELPAASRQSLQTRWQEAEAHSLPELPADLEQLLPGHLQAALQHVWATRHATDSLRFESSRIATELDFVGEPASWLADQLRQHAGNWMMYPHQSLASLSSWAEQLTPQGLMLISDKGWTDLARSPELPEPSRHGKHLEWPVHFPLLQAWLRKQGLTVVHTTHPLWTLHTLMASPGPFAKPLQQQFEQELNLRNVNLFAAELVDSADSAQDAGDPRKAAMLYLQALEHRPGDARIRHQLIACLIEAQAFATAAAWLEHPGIDLFGQFDFAFQQGQLALFEGNYAQATAAFTTSLKQFGPDPASYYNLGLSQMLQQQPAAARLSFQNALNLDPEHELARTALHSWDETFNA